MSPAIPLLSRLMLSCPPLYMLYIRKGKVMNRIREEEHGSVCNVMHLETASPIKLKSLQISPPMKEGYGEECIRIGDGG